MVVSFDIIFNHKSSNLISVKYNQTTFTIRSWTETMHKFVDNWPY